MSVNSVRGFLKSLTRRLQIRELNTEGSRVQLSLSNDRGNVELVLSNTFLPKLLGFTIHYESEVIAWSDREGFVSFPLSWAKTDLSEILEFVRPLADISVRASAEQRLAKQTSCVA